MVRRLRKTQPRRGGTDVSPGRKPWVKREIDSSPFRDGTVLTHTLNAHTTQSFFVATCQGLTCLVIAAFSISTTCLGKGA